jgi:hypothetical protein
MATSKEIKDIVDDLVDLIGMKRGPMFDLIPDSSRVPLERFRHLDVTHMLLGDDWMVLTECTPDVLWPVQSAWAMQQDNGTWHFQQARSISAKDVRGKVRLASRYMLRIDTVSMFPDYRSMAATEIFSMIGKRWVPSDIKTTIRCHDTVRYQLPEDYSHVEGKCNLAISMALRHRYEWSVSIGEPGGASFRFATDPTGIRAILGERDKGESGRRDALRSWVTSHWRQKRSDPDAEVYVRKHLRGSETFSWRGYVCDWSPSAYDVEYNDKLRVERSMMGAQAIRQRLTR